MGSTLGGQLRFSRLTVSRQPGSLLVTNSGAVLAGKEAQTAVRNTVGSNSKVTSNLRCRESHQSNCSKRTNPANPIGGRHAGSDAHWRDGNVGTTGLGMGQSVRTLAWTSSEDKLSGLILAQVVGCYWTDGLRAVNPAGNFERARVQGSGLRAAECRLGSRGSGFLGTYRQVKSLSCTQMRSQGYHRTAAVPGNGHEADSDLEPQGSGADGQQPRNEPYVGGQAAEFLASVPMEQGAGDVGRGSAGGATGDVAGAQVGLRDDVAGSDVAAGDAAVRCGAGREGEDRDGDRMGVSTAEIAFAEEDERLLTSAGWERISGGRGVAGSGSKPVQEETKINGAGVSALDAARDESREGSAASPSARVQGSAQGSVQQSPNSVVRVQGSAAAAQGAGPRERDAEMRGDRDEQFLSRGEAESAAEEKSIDPKRVFVGNLPWETPAPRLCEEVRALFSQYGNVEEVEMATYPKQTQASKEKGKHRGFGFVLMSTAEEAGRVIALLHQRPFRGIPLQVSPAVAKSGPYPPRDGSQPLTSKRKGPHPGRHHTKLFVGGLHKETTAEYLKEIFSNYGKVVDAKVVRTRVTRQSMGFGFVTMPNEESALRAIEDRDGSRIDGNIVKVNIAQFSKVR